MIYFTAAAATKTKKLQKVKSKSNSISESTAFYNALNSFSNSNFSEITKNGCGSVVVNIGDCGNFFGALVLFEDSLPKSSQKVKKLQRSLGPGPIPGRGPYKTLLFSEAISDLK